MKKIIYFIALICAMLTACDSTNQPKQEPDMLPEPKLAIIKLSPEWGNKIIAAPVVDSINFDGRTNVTTLYYGKEIVLYNPNESNKKLANFAQSVLNIVGNSPHLSLSNGYALIDWKWWPFYALSGEGRSATYYSSSMAYWYSTMYSRIENEEYYCYRQSGMK